MKSLGFSSSSIGFLARTLIIGSDFLAKAYMKSLEVLTTLGFLASLA